MELPPDLGENRELRIFLCNRLARASPNPRDPPVITTTLPVQMNPATHHPSDHNDDKAKASPMVVFKLMLRGCYNGI